VNNISVVSGGFDPLHAGHIDYLREAANFGDVFILLNSDKWLTRKKGKPFMEWGERACILNAIKYVYNVMAVADSKDNVCRGIIDLKALSKNRKCTITFCNGGDRTSDNVPELDLCDSIGVNLRFNVGGNKIQSSSTLLKKWEA